MSRIRGWSQRGCFNEQSCSDAEPPGLNIQNESFYFGSLWFGPSAPCSYLGSGQWDCAVLFMQQLKCWHGKKSHSNPPSTLSVHIGGDSASFPNLCLPPQNAGGAPKSKPPFLGGREGSTGGGQNEQMAPGARGGPPSGCVPPPGLWLRADFSAVQAAGARPGGAGEGGEVLCPQRSHFPT